MCNDALMCIGEDEFLRLMASEGRIRRIDDVMGDSLKFARRYEMAIKTISENIPAEVPKNRLTITRESFRQVDDAIQDLLSLKHEYVGRMGNLDLGRLFLMGCFQRSQRAIFNPDPRCMRCVHRQCQELARNIVKPTVRRCITGCDFCKIGADLFPGLSFCESNQDVKRLRRDGVRRSIFEWGRFRDAIVLLQEMNENVISTRRFIHDQGQYLAGLRNVFPARVPDSGPVVLSENEARALIAFAAALKFLKKRFFLRRNRGRRTKRKVRFSLYKMIDKYRWCFRDRRTKIDFDEQTQKNFYENVELSEGFELVVLNVLSNAVKYLPAPEQKREVTISLSNVSAGAVMRVVSLGPPVTAKELKTLGVNMGNRGKTAEEYGIEGEGLGLYAARQYILGEGMTISFDSSGLPYHVGNRTYRNFVVEIRIPNCKLKGCD